MKEFMNPKADHVFIATYGSLRRNMQNFRVNASGGGEFVGMGKTDDNYNLYRYSGCYFPSVSLKHNSNGKQVVVDVFEAPVDGLEGAYDMLEGHNPDSPEGGFYNRTQVPVTLEDGRSVMAYIYHIDVEQSELIESGDWCEHNVEDYYKSL